MSSYPRLTISLGICLMLINSAVFAGMSDKTRRQIEQDWFQQEKVTRKLSPENPEALDAALERGRKMIANMRQLGEKTVTGVTEKLLNEVSAAKEKLETTSGPEWKKLYLKARWAIRKLAFSNPKIDFDQLLFVKRRTPFDGHQCAHRLGEAQLPGSNLCILKGLNPDGKLSEILSGDYVKGGIGRPDLSFDGKRIVFPFARKREKGNRYRWVVGAGTGQCDMYDIYEVGIDGKGLKQITNHPKAEDTEPCYLPNGRIAFTSSRNNRFVQCGDWALVNGIFTTSPDRQDVRKVTEPQDGEFFPSLLSDGRIMYTRWDYVMKPYNTQQQLWAVNPDGRRAELAYGDWYNFSNGPIALFEARQIPGTSKVIATGAAHHNNCAGPIMIVDLNQNRGGPSGMQKVTPEVHYPEIQRKGGGSAHVSATGWYNSPYPIDEKHFLASYTLDRSTRGKYSLYLMDIHGNKELVYSAPEKYSCYSVMPLRPRKRPPVIPDLVHGVPENKPATIIVNDVYQGLLNEGVKRGEVKYLRIVEVHPKSQHTHPMRMDVGVNSGWDTRTVLGTVPVEKDGSAHFTLPPHKLLLFQALDKDYKAIKWMRNYINVKPGETVSCIGCHEPYGMAPPNMTKMPMAARREASKISPPPFAIRGMSFKHIVQPVLDKYCISCHDGSKGKNKAFELRGKKMVAAPAGYDHDQGPQHAVTQSYLNLLKYVTYVKVGGYGNHDPKVLVPSVAKSVGSPASKLMKLLEKGHNKVKLTTDEWRAIAAWIDCNAPYYGDFEEIITEKDLLDIQERKNIAKRKVHLDKMYPKMNIVSYLDCGLATKSTDSSVEKVKETIGRNWRIKTKEKIPGLPAASRTITYSANMVQYELSNLQKSKEYRLGISWWQIGDEGRIQTITIKVPGTNLSTELLAPTNLPNYLKAKQLPNFLILRIPEKFTKHGELLIQIRHVKGHNAIINELFLAVLPENEQGALKNTRHSFAVADLRHHKVKIIDGAKVTWETPVNTATDVSIQPNGNILASGANEVKLLTRDKKVLFHHKGRELFSAGQLSNGHIMINENLTNSVVIKDLSGKTQKSVSTKIPGSKVAKHYHALHISTNVDGTFWVAHRHNNIVRKYDSSGKILRTIPTGISATSVEELANEHVVVACGTIGARGSKGEQGRVLEFNAKNQLIWTLNANEIPEINLMTACGFQKLSNGNLVITNWTGHNYKGDYVPIFEITPEKQIVWKYTDTSKVPEPVGIDIIN